MKILNPFQIFNSKKPEPLKTSSGQLWINYTKAVNSFNPTDYQYLNVAIKVAIYVSTIIFALIATNFTLIADTINHSHRIANVLSSRIG